jgi:hypothetical protein
MARPKNSCAVPSWFKLENYDCLKKLTDKEIWQQVNYHFGFLENVNACKHMKWDFERHFKYSRDTFYKKIMCGDILTDDPHYFEESYYLSQLGDESDETLSRTPSVCGLDTSSIYNYYEALNERGAFKDIKFKGDISNIDSSHGDISLSKIQMKKNKGDYLFPLYADSTNIEICLNIADFTDDEICTDIKKLLKNWREQTNIKEPKVKNQRKSDVYKIISYQIIPLINLATWETINNKSILEQSLAEVVYKGMTIGRNDIQTKFKKFMRHITNDRTYRRNLS